MDPGTVQELVREVYSLQRAVRIADTKAMSYGSLGLAHEGVLMLVAQHDGCRAIDLAAHLGVGPSSLSRQLGELEDLGLVRRRTCESDKRAHLLALTEAGTAHMAEIQESRARLLGAALTSWDAADLANAIDVLARLGAALRAPTPPPADTAPRTTDTHSHQLSGHTV